MEHQTKGLIEKHGDAAVIILTMFTTIIGCTLWLSSKFSDIEKDIAVIKTVMVMKNIMPNELAKFSKEEKK